MTALERVCEQLDCPELHKPLETALCRFGFPADAAAYGAEHLTEWYDLELPGVRRLLTAYLKEFCAIYEETPACRIYASVPSPVVLSAALNETGRMRVYTAELCAMIVLRGIFGISLDRFRNCCESQSRCAMLEYRGGFLRQSLIPTPDLLWSFGLLCDECPKTDETIEGIQRVSTLSTICPRDGCGESDFAYYESALWYDLQKVCTAAGTLVPDGAQAWNKAKLLGILVSTISCTASGAAYPPLKAATLSLLQSTMLMAFGDLDGLLRVLQELLREVRSIRNDGAKKKLYCYYIPPCAPELGAFFAQNGISLVGGAAFLTAPVTQPYADDLAGYCAASWQSCILSRSTIANAETTAAAIRKEHCAGYLTGMFGFDRWLGAGHRLTAKKIEELSGKLVFECHVDFWGRDLAPSRIELYAETIASMLE